MKKHYLSCTTTIISIVPGPWKFVHQLISAIRDASQAKRYACYALGCCRQKVLVTVNSIIPSPPPPACLRGVAPWFCNSAIKLGGYMEFIWYRTFPKSHKYYYSTPTKFQEPPLSSHTKLYLGGGVWGGIFKFVLEF